MYDRVRWPPGHEKRPLGQRGPERRAGRVVDRRQYGGQTSSGEHSRGRCLSGSDDEGVRGETQNLQFETLWVTKDKWRHFRFTIEAWGQKDNGKFHETVGGFHVCACSLKIGSDFCRLVWRKRTATKAKFKWIYLLLQTSTSAAPSALKVFHEILVSRNRLRNEKLKVKGNWSHFEGSRHSNKIHKRACSTASLLPFQRHAGLSLDRCHFIGHSFGAHVAGFAGKRLRGGLGRITGQSLPAHHHRRLHRRVRFLHNCDFNIANLS